MEILEMNQNHINQIVEMEQLYFSDPWSANAFHSEMNNPLALWLVAVEGDRVLGYVGSQTVLGQADMMNLAVRQESRRQGVAQQLVERLIAELSKIEANILMLEVRVSNASAIAFYEKMGFVQVGRRPNYYFKPREDAFIMRKEWTI